MDRVHRPLSLLAIGLWIAAVWVVGPPQGDFANYFTAAWVWHTQGSGETLAQLYDYRWFTGQAAAAGFGDRLVGFPVLTPPSALFAAPALPLGAEGAAWAWQVGQGVCGLLVAWGIARGIHRPLWVGFLALAVLWPALRAHLVQGQFHLPAVVALAWGYGAWVRGRGARAGLLWGLAVGLKVHAWPLLAVLAGLAPADRAARRGLGWAGLTLILGGGVSVALLGWAVHGVWLREIVPAAGLGHFVHPWHPGLASLGHGLRGLFLPHGALNPGALASVPGLAGGVSAGVWAAMVGLSVAGALSSEGPARPRWWAAAAMSALVSGPILSSYHLVLLAPAAAWGVDALWRARAWARILVVGVGLILAVWLPTPSPGSLAGALVAPRFLLLTAAWLAIAPLSTLVRLPTWARAGLVGLVAVAAWRGAAAEQAWQEPMDGAVAVDGPTFPLVAADLSLNAEGTLRFSGLTSDRGALPGRGWVAYRLDPDAGVPEIVDSAPDAHIWAPGRSVQAQDGVVGPVVRLRGGQADVAWIHDGGALTWLTAHPGRDVEPVWDRRRGRVWFLSDRGVGVRALRLWWVPAPAAEGSP